MHRYRHLAMLVILLFWSVAVSAVTLRLKEKHHGVYGLVRQAARMKHAPRGRAANIMSLVIADNGIDVANLDRLPAGMKITVKNRYLRRGFRPTRQAVQMSKMLFKRSPLVETTMKNVSALARGDEHPDATPKKKPVLESPNTAKNKTVLESPKTAPRSGALAEFLGGVKSFLGRRPFAVAFLRQGTVFAALIVLAVILLALFRHRYILMSKKRRHSALAGIVESEIQADAIPIFCRTCAAEGKPYGQCVVLRKNWSRHLERVHASQFHPYIVEDPDLIVGNGSRIG